MSLKRVAYILGLLGLGMLLAVQVSAAGKDIDTPSDYQALTGETLDSALARRRS